MFVLYNQTTRSTTSWPLSDICMVRTGTARDLLLPEDIEGNEFAGYNTVTVIHFNDGSTATVGSDYIVMFK